MDIDAPVRVDCCGFSAQGDDFAEDADGLIGEGVEVFGVDAGGGFGGHGIEGLCTRRVLKLILKEGCKVGRAVTVEVFLVMGRWGARFRREVTCFGLATAAAQVSIF